ncbi:hypothetical protein [Nocardioides campestrisoli]|uniref:hypothetical protein n=1 Tax=Nocardioides campestrisoli TaxID=2736757 RepID=UPI0015E748DB|nr:hypothetical protein [Nocardioides campestrisoli]
MTPTQPHHLALLVCGTTVGALALFEQFEALLPALAAAGAATWILRPAGRHASSPGGPGEGGEGSRVSEPR